VSLYELQSGAHPDAREAGTKRCLTSFPVQVVHAQAKENSPRGAARDAARVNACHDSDSPSRWIARFAPLIVPGARVLDVAAGRGRHARFLAARGAHAIAVDRDADALAHLAGVANVDARIADLEGAPWPFRDRRFDAIVVVHYLHRALFASLLDALADDGVLLYETFAVGNERFGRPSNPAFLLCRDELLERVAGRLEVVAFEQGREDDERGSRVVQRIAAVGRARSWPLALPTGA
jgi:SAM-dependent methyltransferase